jgi:tetratricopeptide (TPR) repeat protein
MDRRDFFISHASEDEQWAEWIAAKLQWAGYKIELDVWEWSAGENFVAAMANGLRRASKVIAVYSASYFTRPYAQAEYHAAFSTSVDAHRPRVIPVQVEECDIPELYRTLIRINIVGVDEETAARKLLEGVATPDGPRREITYPVIAPTSSIGRRSSYPGRFPSIWKIPPRNQFFIGRHAFIHDLHERLFLSKDSGQAVAVVSLQGMGGIGKTQTAVEYAYVHARDYNLAWWVNADTPSLLTDGLVGLADELSLSAGSPQKTIERLWTALSHREDWLLIYDNVDDLTSLGDYRPPTNGHWILTSRNPAVARVAEVIEISEFDRSESLRLLELRVPWLPPVQAQKIAEALGDLPLAVEQAGYFLADTGFDAEDYLQLLTKRPLEAGLGDATIDRHPGLATVVSVSIQRLEATNPLAVQVLKILGLLAPEPVPVMPERPDTEAGSAAFGVRFGDVGATARLVRDLTISGLVRRVGRSLRMHRLIQLLLIAALSSDERAMLEQNAAAWLSSTEPGDSKDTHDWPNYASLLPHVEALVSREPDIASWDDHKHFAELVLDCVDYYYRAGRYNAGLSLARACLTQWRDALGPQHRHTLRMTNNLGMCMTGLKEYQAATELYRDLLHQYTTIVGPTDPLTLRTANNVGVTLSGSRKYVEAVEILSETLDRWRSTVGMEHTEALRTADNLAEALTGDGEYAAAAKLAAEALTARRHLLAPDHPDTLESAYTLGTALVRTDPKRARTLLQDTLDIQKQILGPEHPNTVQTQYALDDLGKELEPPTL